MSTQVNNNNNNNLNKIHKLIMRTARSRIGNNCCRFKNKITKYMQIANYQNMIKLSATNAIHNIIIKRSQNVIKIYRILIPKEFQPTTIKYLPRPEQFECRYISNNTKGQ